MARFSDEFLSELRMRCDIEQIISSYVPLRRRGKNLVGLCPFHNEKTPSFTVYPETESFYCFGCAAGGEVISFIRRIENLDYVEAVRFLCERAGMNMPEDGYDTSLAQRESECTKSTGRRHGFSTKPSFPPRGRRDLITIKAVGTAKRPSSVSEWGMRLTDVRY